MREAMMDDQAFQLLMAKLEDHDKKLDDLLSWKWKLSGITLTVSVIVGIVVQVIINKI